MGAARLGHTQGVREVFRRHPVPPLIGALGLASGGIVLMGWVAGWPEFVDALGRFSPVWLAVAAAGQVAAYVGYVLAYRAVLGDESVERMRLALCVRLVVAGFGGFEPGGGFGIDQRAMRALDGDRRAATVRALAMGGVEYAAIAPAACVSAIVLLIAGSAIHGAVLWPWAIAVPAGFALALPAAARRQTIVGGRTGRGWVMLDHALESVAMLPRIWRRRTARLEAFGGCALYWAGEALSLWGGLRAFGGQLSFAALIIAVATGYALTRRSMPLGGAGVTEILMSYALSWCGVALPVAVAAVVVYRGFAFAVPMLPGLLARHDLIHLPHRQASAGRSS
jgi:putative heme transporter